MSTSPTVANAWATVAWINSHRVSQEDEPLVVFDGVVENVPGRTTVRVYRTNRFRPDTTLQALIEMFKTHYGECAALDVGKSTDISEYEWQLTETRWLRLIGKPGIGTFIQLIDKGTA